MLTPSLNIGGAGTIMIRTKTVMVVGAGASNDFGFPIGGKLLDDIRKALNFTFSHDEAKTGDRGLLEVFRRVAADPQNNRVDRPRLNRLIHAGHRIGKSAVGGDSIDNVIDQLDGDEDVQLVGKLAIAYHILKAEKSSPLFSQPQTSAIQLQQIQDTWLFQLMRIIRTDIRRSLVDTIFDNLSIITFNYDRTIEYFLPSALAAVYHIEIDEAREITRRLPVFHPYGQVGRLPWMTNNPLEEMQFGDGDVDRVSQAARQIRTFGEQLEEGDELRAMRTALTEATNVVFLGFGFHRQNMRLLACDPGAGPKRVWSTFFGMPKPGVEEAVRLIEVLCRSVQPFRETDILRADCKCHTLLSDCFMPLTG